MRLDKVLVPLDGSPLAESRRAGGDAERHRRGARRGGGPAIQTRRILHPSDFSSAVRAVFARAVALAKAERAELLLAHVMTPVIPLVGEGYISPKISVSGAHGSRKVTR